MEEQIKRTVSSIIAGSIHDPRVGMVDITAVEVTPDLREAKIYFRTLGDRDEAASTLEGLRSARGYIQRELGSSLNTKYTPVIKFFPDHSSERIKRIERVIKKIRKEEEDRER